MVSLFADITYEGARSNLGAYLALLGASATTVATIAGLGECLGYGLRFVFGVVADRTRWYWGLTFLGYATNLLAVPIMGFAGSWQSVSVLVLLERLGKAIRSPSRDAMLSHATSQLGHGWGFGLHEALDQIGAVAGPLVLAILLLAQFSYAETYRFLGLAALLALAFLFLAWILYRNPDALEPRPPFRTSIPISLRWFLVAACLTGFGYADFPLLAFHFQKHGLLNGVHIAAFYAMAMAADAVAALAFGKVFDRSPRMALSLGVLAGACFAPCVFVGGQHAIGIGILAWGVGLGVQESCFKAAVAISVPPEWRARMYGLYYFVYGLSWFAGSTLIGILYDQSLLTVVVLSAGSQLLAVAILMFKWVNAPLHPVPSQPA